MPLFTDEYDGLARDLEEEAGIDPPPGLRRDIDNSSITRRIRRALASIWPAIAAAIAAAVEDGVGGTTRYITFSVQDADGLKVHAGRGTRCFPVWANVSGSTFRIVQVTASSDQDNYVFTLYKSASLIDLSVANDTQLVAIDVSDDGSSQFVSDATSFDSDTIENGTWLIWEHTSGTADVLTVTIEGHFE